MTKNPLFNALGAILYIAIVASIMYYGPKSAGSIDSVVVPVAILSLFVLSAAVMGYIFCYTPLQLFLEGQKKEAAGLFLKTVGVFAGITFLLLSSLFLLPFVF